jgi:hypothetical protein
MDRDLGPSGYDLQQVSRELMQMGLGEVAIECLAIGPLLHRDEAVRVR